MILGAAGTWNPDATDKEYFDRAVCVLNYKCDDLTPINVYELLNKSDEIGILSQVLNLCGTKLYSGYNFDTKEFSIKKLYKLIQNCKKSENMVTKKSAEGNLDNTIAKSLISAAMGYKLMLQGFDIYCNNSKYPEWEKRIH